MAGTSKKVCNTLPIDAQAAVHSAGSHTWGARGAQGQTPEVLPSSCGSSKGRTSRPRAPTRWNVLIPPPRLSFLTRDPER